ncbi:hypothetical protein ACP26L_13365 [Paenibacillus sp. S-38]|uniref:hypothetical protein n=1 Tax=Paenibacillus sp. S-38 TaxID=3416710 RepID=UPI003CF0AC26
MLRYWKLTVLLPLITLVIGSYYATAYGGRPEYILDTIRGNGSEAESLALQASDGGFLLEISKEGSRFRSIWEYLYGDVYVTDTRLKEKAAEYRDFMRGVTHLNGIVEDDSRLVRAELKSERVRTLGEETKKYRFQISLLDKSTGNQSTWEIPIVNEEVFPSIDLHNVLLQGQTLNLFTYKSKMVDNVDISEFHRYTVDLNTKQLIEDRTILSRENSAGIYLINEQDPTQANRYAVFHKIYASKNAATLANEIQYHELFIFDNQTGILEKVQSGPLDELLKSKAEVGMSYNAEEIYLTSWANPKEPRVMRYNIKKTKVTHDHRISMDGAPLRADVSYGQISHNRIYLLLNPNMFEDVPPGVVIADLESGKVMYEGVVARTDSGRLERFSIRDMKVQ